MILLTVLISLAYSVLIISFIIGFDAIEYFNVKAQPIHKFSIIIPFRNEAKNLPDLLHSISEINYPKDFFEILLVDDNSTDNFKTIIDGFKASFPQLNISLLQNEYNSASPKKNAIKTAVSKSKVDWILTTDADCEVPKNWLQTFNAYIKKNGSVFIAAPVKFKYKTSLLFTFQQLNLTSLIGSTIGSFGIEKPIMCNGANLCYSKKAFNKVNGFEDNEKFASGDDVFLLEKMIKEYPKRVHYLKSKDALVTTKSEKTWKDFFNQQIRWAGKSSGYQNKFTKFVGLTVFLENLILILLFALSLLTYNYSLTLLIAFVMKFTLDYTLIFKIKKILSIKNQVFFYILSNIIYPFFAVSIGITSLVKGYTWKDRNYKK